MNFWKLQSFFILDIMIKMQDLKMQDGCLTIYHRSIGQPYIAFKLTNQGKGNGQANWLSDVPSTCPFSVAITKCIKVDNLLGNNL